MRGIKELRSSIDKSVNWLIPVAGKKSVLETRYVRKKDDYIISYVSSSVGCVQKCKQCFLTQQKQFEMYHVKEADFANQVERSINHYLTKDHLGGANRININFMAKGEPLVNPTVVNSYPSLYNRLNKMCTSVGLQTKVNISTIMPGTMKHNKLQWIFGDTPVNLYYSLYSINEAFRKKWMPNAIDWRLALDKLKDYQENGGGVVTFHWANIAGENDKLEDVNALANVLREYKFNAKFNVVRFNAHDNLTYKESDPERINEVFQIVNDALGNNPKSYIVPRVGKDVSASCGMFVAESDADL